MHLDLYIALAGLVVGFTVGLTGMGGGALMTPILVLLFKVQPLAAVSSDLVVSMVMKPVGGAVHLRRGTVNKDLVRWLVLGSVPAAFSGVLILRMLGDGQQVQDRIRLALGAALLLAAASIVAKAFLQVRRRARLRALGGTGASPVASALQVKPLPTMLIGVLGGLVVGMTSVGSGSLIIVLLLILYPSLRASQLVGTDLVQAVPLVASAALGHLLFGDFKLGLTTSLLVGSLPGVYIGAKVSARAPEGTVRRALALVLFASGLKLIEVGTVELGWILLAVLVVAKPAWGFVRATNGLTGAPRPRARGPRPSLPRPAAPGPTAEKVPLV